MVMIGLKTVHSAHLKAVAVSFKLIFICILDDMEKE